MMQVLWAFLKRDASVFCSYHMGVFLRICSFIFTLAPFFFISELMAPGTIEALRPYGGEFFPFVLVGLTFSRYVGVSLSGLSGALREEQLQGTLEALWLTPQPLPLLFVAVLVWDFLWTTVEVFLFLLMGWMLFGAPLNIDWPATLAMLAATMTCLMGLGLIAACCVLIFREADPVNWALGGLMRLLAGTYFPLAVLPGWLQDAAQWIPLTHALEGLRQAVLMGAGLHQMVPYLTALTGFSLLFWPVAMLSLSGVAKYLRREGSLNFR